MGRPCFGPWERIGKEKGAVFSFLYLKKLKFQKYMSVLENFKNIPRSPYGGRQGSNVIFFLQIYNEVPREKKEGACRPPCRPPQGRPTNGPSLQAPGGPVAPPHGRPGQAAYIRPPHIPSSHLTSKNPKKPRKKRGVRRREAANLCRIPHL